MTGGTSVGLQEPPAEAGTYWAILKGWEDEGWKLVEWVPGFTPKQLSTIGGRLYVTIARWGPRVLSPDQEVFEAIDLLREQVRIPLGISLDRDGWPLFRFAEMENPEKPTPIALALEKLLNWACVGGFRWAEERGDVPKVKP